MQYIKMSLLSILIFFLGISTIVLGNTNNLNNYQKNFTNPENSLSSVVLSNEVDEQARFDSGALTPTGIDVVFGDKFFSEDKTTGGKVTVNASWVRNQDVHGPAWGDSGLNIKLIDGETDTGLFENNIFIENGYETDELSFTQEGEYTEANDSWIFEDGNTVSFSATIRSEQDKIIDKAQHNPDYNKNYYNEQSPDFGKGSPEKFLDENDPDFNHDLFINNTFSFEENHEYRFEIFIYSSGAPYYSDTKQVVNFTTPSKSVINLTDTTGDITNIRDDSITIDTSYIINKDQISDDVYPIDENITIDFDTPMPQDYPTKPIIEFADDNQEATLSGLVPSTVYSNWKLNISYFNGIENVLFPEIEIGDDGKFKTNDTVSYNTTTVKFSEITETSVSVTLDITNELAKDVGVKFYNNKDEVPLESHIITSFGSGEPIEGEVTYQITSLDYNTKYNLEVQINENKRLQLEGFTTLDKYPWSNPLNITLFVLILVEVTASVSVFTILWINSRKRA